MENERETKFQKLMADKAFVEGLAQQVQPEDAQAYFAANGVDFTLEEIKALGKAISLRAKQQRGEELTEDELAEVSGGSWVEWASVGVGILSTLFVAAILYLSW